MYKYEDLIIGELYTLFKRDGTIKLADAAFHHLAYHEMSIEPAYAAFQKLKRYKMVIKGREVWDSLIRNWVLTTIDYIRTHGTKKYIKQEEEIMTDIRLIEYVDGKWVCKDHPKYGGLRKPRTECPGCWAVYKRKKALRVEMGEPDPSKQTEMDKAIVAEQKEFGMPEDLPQQESVTENNLPDVNYTREFYQITSNFCHDMGVLLDKMAKSA